MGGEGGLSNRGTGLGRKNKYREGKRAKEGKVIRLERGRKVLRTNQLNGSENKKQKPSGPKTKKKPNPKTLHTNTSRRSKRLHTDQKTH